LDFVLNFVGVAGKSFTAHSFQFHFTLCFETPDMPLQNLQHGIHCTDSSLVDSPFIDLGAAKFPQNSLPEYTGYISYSGL
jgi:hypothetical protein